jgi:hypothetical protein
VGPTGFSDRIACLAILLDAWHPSFRALVQNRLPNSLGYFEVIYYTWRLPEKYYPLISKGDISSISVVRNTSIVMSDTYFDVPTTFLPNPVRLLVLLCDMGLV